MTNPTATSRTSSAVGSPATPVGGPPLAASPDSAGRPTLPGPYANTGSAWAPASAATPIRTEDVTVDKPNGLFSGTGGAAVVGGAVAAWMALPDLFRGRAARVVLKLGILGGVAAWGVVRSRTQKALAPKGVAALGRVRPHAPATDSRAGEIARGCVIGGAAVAALIVADSLGHQGAKFLAARGTPAPHALLGLAAGAVSAVGVSSKG